MSAKGPKLAERKNYVFRYTDKNEQNVVQTVNTNKLDLPEGDQVTVEVHKNKGRSGMEKVLETEVHVSKNGESITIPIDALKSAPEIKPGQTADLRFYEVKSESQDKTQATLDNSGLLDTVGVRSDKTSTDGCYSTLVSERAAEYLKDPNNTQLRLKNIRTGDATVAGSHSNYESNDPRISFPYKARRAINANPKDRIELYRVDNDIDSADETKLSEKVEEMHSMISEMYDAFVTHKND